MTAQRMDGPVMRRQLSEIARMHAAGETVTAERLAERTKCTLANTRMNLDRMTRDRGLLTDDTYALTKDGWDTLKAITAQKRETLKKQCNRTHNERIPDLKRAIAQVVVAIDDDDLEGAKTIFEDALTRCGIKGPEEAREFLIATGGQSWIRD